MIINEAISLAIPEKFQRKRFTLKKQGECRGNKQGLGSHQRLFTERSTQKNFNDYEIGKKIIGDLPGIKINKLKNRSTAYDQNFSLATQGTQERHSIRVQLTNEMEKMKKEFALTSEEEENWQFETAKPNYTHYLKRYKTESIEDESKDRRYSLFIPTLAQIGIKKQKTPETFKKRVLKNRRNSSPYTKTYKTQIQQPEQSISSFIKIEKKSLNQIKINKELINKVKLMNYQSNNHKARATINSRIQPWNFSFTHNDIDIF